MLRYADWRAVISEYVAERRDEQSTDIIPQTVAHAALGVSMAGFTVWVESETLELETALNDAWSGLIETLRGDA